MVWSVWKLTAGVNLANCNTAWQHCLTFDSWQCKGQNSRAGMPSNTSHRKGPFIMNICVSNSLNYFVSRNAMVLALVLQAEKMADYDGKYEIKQMSRGFELIRLIGHQDRRLRDCVFQIKTLNLKKPRKHGLCMALMLLRGYKAWFCFRQ